MSESDTEVIVSLAVTLDGYIAREDGSFDYLNKYMESSGQDEIDFFNAWMDRVGALVMGRTSYEVLLEGEPFWGDRPILVLTSRTDLPVPDGANVTFKSAPGATAEAVREFSAVTPKRCWIFGGGVVATEALLGGGVDLLEFGLMPEAIGSGIPLFAQPFYRPMELVETVKHNSGVVRLTYKIDNS